jgi:hypothetical protein
MPFAMCADTGMLVGILFIYPLVGAVCLAPFIFALAAFVRWADARQKRPAAGS